MAADTDEALLACFLLCDPVSNRLLTGPWGLGMPDLGHQVGRREISIKLSNKSQIERPILSTCKFPQINLPELTWSQSKSKNPSRLFFFPNRIWQAGSKICIESKEPKIGKTTLKKNQIGGLTVPDFKMRYKASWSKTSRYWVRTDAYINETERIVKK